jgi:predicted small integral membrane protein
MIGRKLGTVMLRLRLFSVLTHRDTLARWGLCVSLFSLLLKLGDILMPKIDKLKADISFHEKLFFGSMAAIFAVVAWVAAHYKTAEWWELLISLIMMLGASFFSIDQYKRIKRLIQELEIC